VEFFFVFEICLQMLTGAFNDKGVYVDHVPTVVMMYFRRPWLDGFAFDVITSVPFSWLELVLWLRQCGSGDGKLSGWALQMKAPLRMLRPLRLLRLFRFVKVMRVWSQYGVAVPLRVQKMIGTACKASSSTLNNWLCRRCMQ
jgi:hypothetical protein